MSASGLSLVRVDSEDQTTGWPPPGLHPRTSRDDARSEPNGPPVEALTYGLLHGAGSYAAAHLMMPHGLRALGNLKNSGGGVASQWAEEKLARLRATLHHARCRGDLPG